ncbi:MAG: hypothetical protein ABJE47_11110 [bacterium]
MTMDKELGSIRPSPLKNGTVDPVRAAFLVYLSDGSQSSVLQDALSRMSLEARHVGMLPEHLIIVLKDIWNGLPEVRAMRDIDEQVRLLEGAVTMCIKEYYRA